MKSDIGTIILCIEELRDKAAAIPLYDGTNKIITPVGYEATIEVRVLNKVLRELKKHGN